MENNINGISFIIPVYNEESRIGHSLEKITAYLNPLDFEYEIIIIDDGSKDNTLSVIQAFNQNIHPLKIYNYMPNRGKGYAVSYGMLKGTGKYRLFTDADLSTPIQEVQSILGYLDQEYDICIASRAQNSMVSLACTFSSAMSPGLGLPASIDS